MVGIDFQQMGTGILAALDRRGIVAVECASTQEGKGCAIDDRANIDRVLSGNEIGDRVACPHCCSGVGDGAVDEPVAAAAAGQGIGAKPYRAQSWKMPRRVVAKVEWHPGELYPRVGFIVTNLSRPAKRVVAFYNQRGTAEQYIKEGKNAIVWTRLSCRKFQHNAVCLQFHTLAYNLGNFMLTLALPEVVKHWSLTSLREKLVKIGARIVGHGRYITFQMAEVAVPRGLFGEILRLIAQLRPPPAPA